MHPLAAQSYHSWWFPKLTWEDCNKTVLFQFQHSLCWQILIRFKVKRFVSLTILLFSPDPALMIVYWHEIKKQRTLGCSYFYLAAVNHLISRSSVALPAQSYVVFSFQVLRIVITCLSFWSVKACEYFLAPNWSSRKTANTVNESGSKFFAVSGFWVV